MSAELAAQATGSLLGGIMGQRANEQNIALNRENRDWQEKMSNTAHQRQVKDLMAAGLNPNLSAGGGSGASSPSMGQATVTAPEIHMPDMLAYGVSLKQLEQTDRKLDMENKALAVSMAKDMSQTDLNKMEKILKQRGVPRALFEGEVSELLRTGIKALKGDIKTPKLSDRDPYKNTYDAHKKSLHYESPKWKEEYKKNNPMHERIKIQKP